MASTTFILTATIKLNLNGADPDLIHQRMVGLIEDGVQIGGITGNTAAEVLSWAAFSGEECSSDGQDFEEERRATTPR